MYDESSQICCEYNGSFSIDNNKNRDCCYDRAYKIEHQHCANGQVLGFDENVCGKNNYNVSAKICCDGTLHDTPLFLPKCCGSNLYDFSQSQCCLKTKKVVAPICIVVEKASEECINHLYLNQFMFLTL